MPGTDIPEWINAATVERAYGRARDAQRKGQMRFAEKGMRAAYARDSRLLQALEGGAEVIAKVAEVQTGRYRRDPHTMREKWSHTVEPTEAALWRNAYESCDKGAPMQQLCWVYGAAAELAGL